MVLNIFHKESRNKGNYASFMIQNHYFCNLTGNGNVFLSVMTNKITDNVCPAKQKQEYFACCGNHLELSLVDEESNEITAIPLPPGENHEANSLPFIVNKIEMVFPV